MHYIYKVSNPCCIYSVITNNNAKLKCTNLKVYALKTSNDSRIAIKGFKF